MNQQSDIQRITSQIIILPGRPLIMLDRDLATLFETDTRHINQAMKRNKERFPDDFCFQLCEEETKKVGEDPVYAVTDCDRNTGYPVPDCDRIKPDKRNKRYLPYAYTREGCNMLAMVLHTQVAIDRSVWIIRAFTSLERAAAKHPYDAPSGFAFPNGWVLHCLIKIHGTEGAARVLRDWWGIAPDAFKDSISPFEMSVIRKDNPNRLHRDQCIAEIAARGVSVDLIAGISGLTRTHVHGIIKPMKLIAERESMRALAKKEMPSD